MLAIVPKIESIDADFDTKSGEAKADGVEAIRQIEVIWNEQAEIVRAMKIEQETFKTTIELTNKLERRLQE